MLDRLTLTLSAMLHAKECRKASEAGDTNRLIQHADALKVVALALRNAAEHEWPWPDTPPHNIPGAVRVGGADELRWSSEGVR